MFKPVWKKGKKKKEIKEKGSVQGFEIFNVEGSLKGEKKQIPFTLSFVFGYIWLSQNFLFYLSKWHLHFM